MKTNLQKRLAVICLSAILSFSMVFATQYCYTPVISTDGTATVYLTCQSTGTDQYEFKVESDVVITGFNNTTLWMHINGSETYNFSQYITLSGDGKTLSTTITSTTTPSIYSGIMFINYPGEKQFNLPSDIDWTTVCSVIPDTEAPVMVSAVLVGEATHNSATLFLSATDDITNPVTRFIANDATNNIINKELIADASGNAIISGLTPSTTYNLTITSKDAAGNISLNSSNITFTTTEQLAQCYGEKGHFATPGDTKIGYVIRYAEGNVIYTITPVSDERTLAFAELQTTSGSFAMTIAGDAKSATYTQTGLTEGSNIAIRFLYRLDNMGGNDMTAENLSLTDQNIIDYLVGDCSSIEEPENDAPTDFNASIVKANSDNVVIQLSAQDANKVYYVIYTSPTDSVGFGPFTADGTVTNVTYTELIPETFYTFHPIVVKDIFGNRTTFGSSLSATTTVSTDCSGEGNEFEQFVESSDVNPSENFSFYYKIQTFENEDGVSIDSVKITCEFLDDELPEGLQFVPQVNWLYKDVNGVEQAHFRDMTKINSDPNDQKYKTILPDISKGDPSPIQKEDTVKFYFYYAWSTGGLSSTDTISYVVSKGCSQDKYNDYVIDSTEVKNFNVKTTFRANLIIRSGDLNTGMLTNSNETKVSQHVKLEKTVTGGKWYFISFPYDIKVTDIKKYSIDIEEDIGVYGTDWMVAYFDTQRRDQVGVPLGNWIQLPYESSMEIGKGYIFISVNDAVVRFLSTETGLSLIRNQDIEKTLADYSTHAHNWHHNWHLIGQPFFSTLEGENLQGPAYMSVYQYPTDSYSDVERTSYQMKPFSSVFVQYHGQVDFLAEETVLTAMRASSLFKQNKYKLELNNGTYSDYTQINLNETGSEDYKIGGDFLKMLTKGNLAPQIYSIDSEKNINLSFNELYIDEVVTVKLGTYFPTASEHTITLCNTDVETKEVLLTDNYENKTIDLKLAPYTFFADSGTDDNRFNLIISQVPKVTTDVVDNNTEANILVLIRENCLFIDNLPENAMLRIYDIVGRSPMLIQRVKEPSLTISDFKSGMYILHIEHGSKKTSFKLVF